MTVAFVFARGGSKGVPGKNLRLLGGVPLVGHSVLMAKQLDAVKRVFVSTDSSDISAVAAKFGADVIRRPDQLATDNSPEWLSWQHAIQHVYSLGHAFDTFLSLPATCPLRARTDVEQCLAALDDNTDAVVTVTPAASNPYFNMVTRAEDGTTQVLLSAGNIHRRQDAPDIYDLTAVAYVSRCEFVLRHTRLFEGRVRSVIVPRERAIDIDDAVDFLVATALFDGRAK